MLIICHFLTLNIQLITNTSDFRLSTLLHHVTPTGLLNLDMRPTGRNS